MSKVKFNGRSEDEAVQRAADVLGIGPDEVRYKIVSRSSGLLGILSQTVTIEVSIGERTGTPPPEADPEPDSPAPDSRGPGPAGPGHRDRGAARRGERPQKAESESELSAEPEEDTALAEPAESVRRPEREGPPPDRRDRRPRKSGRSRPAPQRHDGPPDSEGEEHEVIDEAVFQEKTARASEVIRNILQLAGATVELATHQRRAEIVVTATGDLPEWLLKTGTGALDSIQFLANKIVNRFPPRYRVVVSLEGQKDERIEQIKVMAGRLAAKVAESGESVWVLPMTAKERRAVHMVVSQIPGLLTRSVGDGPTRRLCICKATAASPKPDAASLEPESDL